MDNQESFVFVVILSANNYQLYAIERSGLSAKRYFQEEAIATMKQISQTLYTFSGLRSGCVYATKDPDGLTLIDAGLASAPAAILSQMRGAGYGAEDIKRILITHAHLDHVGGLPELKRLSGAEVITSTLERPVVEGRESLPLRGIMRTLGRSAEPLPGTPVARTVEDGEVLGAVLGGLQVLHVPGHTPGHLAFWQPEQRVLFVGDVILALFGLRLPFAAFTVDMDENRRSVKRLAELGAKMICSGHGKPVTKNAARKMRRFAERL